MNADCTLATQGMKVYAVVTYTFGHAHIYAIYPSKREAFKAALAMKHEEWWRCRNAGMDPDKIDYLFCDHTIKEYEIQ